MPSPALHELPPPPEWSTVWPWTRPPDVVPDRLPDGREWPLITIVTPSLNQGAYLEQALRSLLLQGYPRLELIVIDGGSTDATLEVIAKYERWLAHWSSQPDRGPAHALNVGFARANGEILGVLNADDFLLPGCLVTVARAFVDEGTADVVAGHGYFAKASGELGAPIFSDAWNQTRFAYGACVLVQQATFFRREAFQRAGGFRESGRVCWDMELWADLARSGARFRSVSAFLAAFRLHDASISGGRSLRQERRDAARAVMAEFRGRPETRRDRLLHGLFRAWKFARHPARTARQRAFLFTALNRWSS